MARATITPPTAKGRSSRDRIVEVAAALVSARGVEGTSVDAVLEAAGAGKSQLYHYFGDKQGLVQAVVEYREQTVIRPLGQALAAVQTWQDLGIWFDGIVEHQVATQCREGCPVGALASELSERDEESRATLAMAFDRWEQDFAELLKRFRSTELLDEEAPVDQLASMTLATIQGALLLARTRRDERPLRAALDQVYLHLLSYATE